MKKIIFAFAAFATAFSLVSCNKEQVETPSTDFKLNIKVANLDGSADTKAIKTGWANGDKLNVYFDSYTTFNDPQMTLTYNAGNWDATYKAGFDVAASLSASGVIKVLFEGSNNISRYSNTGYATAPKAGDKTVFAYGLQAYCTKDYSFDGSVLTAVLDTWTFASGIQVVVTGINDASNYALRCDNLLRQSAGINSDRFTYGSGSYNEYVIGFPNEDGVAFYFGSPRSSAVSDYIFTLYDYSDGTVKQWTAAGKTLPDDKTSLTGVKFAYGNFGTAYEFSHSDNELFTYPGGSIDFKVYNISNNPRTEVTEGITWDLSGSYDIGSLNSTGTFTSHGINTRDNGMRVSASIGGATFTRKVLSTLRLNDSNVINGNSYYGLSVTKGATGDFFLKYFSSYRSTSLVPDPVVENVTASDGISLSWDGSAKKFNYTIPSDITAGNHEITFDVNGVHIVTYLMVS